MNTWFDGFDDGWDSIPLRSDRGACYGKGYDEGVVAKMEYQRKADALRKAEIEMCDACMR